MYFCTPLSPPVMQIHLKSDYNPTPSSTASTPDEFIHTNFVNVNQYPSFRAAASASNFTSPNWEDFSITKDSRTQSNEEVAPDEAVDEKK
jgi:hypothetical protein